MKRLLYNIIFAMAVICVTSCGDLEDTYSQYLGDGERIYVGKPDTITVFEGYGRLKVQGGLKYANTAVACIIEVDGKTYKEEIVKGQKKFEILIPDLKEGSYDVSVHTIDKNGNTSLTDVINALVYGENYLSTLSPKRITEFTPRPNGSIELDWNQVEKVSDVLVTYIDAAGSENSITVDSKATKTIIPSWKMGSVLKAVSHIKPDEKTLDIMSLETDEYDLPEEAHFRLERANFKDMRMSSDAPVYNGLGVSNLWNEAYNDWWTPFHSDPGVPQHVTIDLGVISTVSKCKIYFQPLPQEWTPTEFQIWGIEDVDDLNACEPDVPSLSDEWEAQAIAKGWKKLTSENLENTDGAKTEIEFGCNQSISDIRYLRYRILRVVKPPHVGNSVYSKTEELQIWGSSINELMNK